MHMIKITRLILNLFDGGGDGGGAAAGTTGAAGADSAGTTGDTNSRPASTRRGKTGEFSNVLFGKQPEAAASAQEADADSAPDAGEQEKSESEPAERRKFSDLIRGEYKDDFTAEVQRIINNRFKQTKGLEEQIAQTQPILDALYDKYGVKNGDAAALTQAFRADRENWSDAAEAHGMSVEGYQAHIEMERQLRREMENSRQLREQMAARKQAEAWAQESAEVAKKYPNFSLSAELENPEFQKLLRGGVPMEHAYRVMHLDEIVGGVAQSTAETTRNKVVANIKARGARPAENAQSGQSGFTVKDDVSKLSRKDRAEIARRAARGEIISF